MEVNIQELEKELNELKSTCASSFAKIEVLEEKMIEANGKINQLTLANSKGHEDKGHEDKTETSCDQEIEHNQMMVQKLSCDEVRRYLIRFMDFVIA